MIRYSNLAQRPHFGWEKLRCHQVGHWLNSEIHEEDKDTANDDTAPVNDGSLILHVPVLQMGGKEQGGAKGSQAGDGRDSGDHIQVSSLEPGLKDIGNKRKSNTETNFKQKPDKESGQ